MNPAALYNEHLETFKRIAGSVAHKAHLSPEDTEDFRQIVCLRLFEDDYAILRKFEGRSTLATYLNTVIKRLYNQWRVEMWGKWRPSAEARRIGDVAITLERLITRDGYTYDEAVSAMTTPSGAGATPEQLEAIYLRLPPRNPRPVFVSGDVVPDVIAVEADADERVQSRERERTARCTVKALDCKLAAFSPQDRLILRLRFVDCRKVREIAQALSLDPKKVFKRLDKLYLTLRRALEADGVSKTDVDAVMGRGDHEIRLKLLESPGNSAFRPSHRVRTNEPDDGNH